MSWRAKYDPETRAIASHKPCGEPGANDRAVTTASRQLVNTLEAGEIFHKVSSRRNAVGGWHNQGGDLAGPGEVLRREDGAQVWYQTDFSR